MVVAVERGSRGVELEKSEGDKREYRLVTLPNGLAALLISDPDDQGFFDPTDSQDDDDGQTFPYVHSPTSNHSRGCEITPNQDQERAVPNLT